MSDIDREQAREDARKLSHALKLVEEVEPSNYNDDRTEEMLETVHRPLDEVAWGVHQYAEGERP